MKKCILLIILFLFTNLHGQWVEGISGSGNESGSAIVTDNSGNVYTVGYFEGTVDFDPTSGTANLTSNGNNDIYIAKYSTTTGALIWAENVGGTGDDYGQSIAIDGSGNIYIAGYFQSTADFDPSGGTENLTSAGSSDIFFAKYSSTDGSLIWAKSIGESSNDNCYTIAIDGSGNVLIIGTFQNTVDFDPSVDGTTELTSAGNSDIFFAKYSGTDGSLIWARNVGGTSSDFGSSIALDGSGNLYITGYFQGIADFDPTSGVKNRSSAGSGDIYIVEYSGTDGSRIRDKKVGSTGSDGGNSIAVDGNGNIYITGYFSGIVDFDPNNGVTDLTSAGSTDIFCAKFNNSFNLQWAKRAGSTSADYGAAITVGAGGDVYITGRFQKTADFYVSGVDSTNLVSVGANDIFIAKYNSSGVLQWTKNAGGLYNDYSYAIDLDGTPDVYITGNFFDVADFDPAGGTESLTSVGGSDIFIAKYPESGSLPVELTSFNINQEGSVLKLKWETATEVNNYGFEIERASLNPSEGGTSGAPLWGDWGAVGFVNGSGNSNSPKGYSFTDENLTAGTYEYRLKQIDNDGTFEYSDVVEVSFGIPEQFALEQNYPNPFNPTTKIKYSVSTSPQSPPYQGGEAKQGWLVQLKVYDVLGNEVATLVNEIKQPGNYEVNFDAGGLSSGIYFYQLKTDNFVQTKKMLMLK